jgi:thioredoxin-related protein
MKKGILITIFVIATSAILFSQEKKEKVKWHSFEEAVALSKENPKKLFIDVYTDWCGWCKKMEKETFNHPVIAKYLNENFYAVKFDAESTKPIEFAGTTFVNGGTETRNTHQLAIALLQGKLSYPSVAYMNEEMQLLTAIAGFKTPAEIEPILNYFAKDKYKSVGWTDFQASFESEIKE